MLDLNTVFEIFEEQLEKELVGREIENCSPQQAHTTILETCIEIKNELTRHNLIQNCLVTTDLIKYGVVDIVVVNVSCFSRGIYDDDTFCYLLPFGTPTNDKVDTTDAYDRAMRIL